MLDPLFAQDVLNWMDQNNKDQMDIFGYSMGGYIALYLAMHHPNRVNRIVTLATKFDWDPDSAANETMFLNPDKIEGKLPQFAKLLDQRHSDWKKLLKKTIEMMINVGDEPAIDQDSWATITHRIMLISGDSDTTATPVETINIHNKLINSTITILPDTPHPIEKVDKSILSIHINKFFGT